jgi:hypothetical protein
MQNQHPMSDDEVHELALARIRNGGSRADVEIELMAMGYSREETIDISRAASQAVRNKKKSQTENTGDLKILVGGIFVAIGLATKLYAFGTSGTVIAPAGILGLGGLLIAKGASRT